MQAPNKKSLIAAAAAPFALTLALGAAPAYANGNGNQSGQTNASATTNANESSEAKITFNGCQVNSDKEISYVEYFLDGESVKKREDVNSAKFSLDQTLEFDSVTVKAGTTVVSDASCATVIEESQPEDESEEQDSGEQETGEQETGEQETGEQETGEQETGEQETGEQETGQREDVGGGRDNDNNNRDGNSDTVAGAEASAGADVSGNVSSEVQGNASAGTPEAGGEAVLGAEGETQAYQPTAADGSTQYLPNTGAEENAALIAGGAGLAGFGAWMMLKRRRFGLER